MGSRRIKAKRKQYRSVRLDGETAAAMRTQLAAFRAKFGRDPGPNDPVFFDPTKDEPTPIPEDVIAREVTSAMAKVGIDPHLIYAYHKTGLWPMQETLHRFSKADLKEWDDAIAEFHNTGGKPN